MEGYELDSRRGEDFVAFVRALSRHRYVASRLHLVHVFAVDAARECQADGEDPLTAAFAWADSVLGDRTIDRGSKDERLQRRATDVELASVLSAFWMPGDGRLAARARLLEHLDSVGVEVDSTQLPFDEACEDELFPILVDAGWELLPLAKLDPERHKGAIAAFDDFEVARFEEENSVPPMVTLHELPLLGALELAFPFADDGLARAPFVLWQTGHPRYLDYVLRGVLRAAKLAVTDPAGGGAAQTR